MAYDARTRMPDLWSGGEPATPPIIRDLTSALANLRKTAERSIAERPLVALVIAVATGGLLGWLVKRR